MDPEAPWYRWWAWTVVAGVGLLLVLFGVFVLFAPVSADDFEGATGVTWEAFSAGEAEAAAYLEREARLLASVLIGFGLFAAGLAATLVRSGNRTAWALEWIFPSVLGLTVVVFFLDDAVELGSYYVVVTAVVAAALWLARPTG